MAYGGLLNGSTTARVGAIGQTATLCVRPSSLLATPALYNLHFFIYMIPRMTGLSDDAKIGLIIFGCVLFVGGIFVLLMPVVMKARRTSQRRLFGESEEDRVLRLAKQGSNPGTFYDDFNPDRYDNLSR